MMEFDFDEEEVSPFPQVRNLFPTLMNQTYPPSQSACGSSASGPLPDTPSAFPLTPLCIPRAMNIFFNFRQPVPHVVALVLIISYSIGKFLAFSLPITPPLSPIFDLGLGISEISPHGSSRSMSSSSSWKMRSSPPLCHEHYRHEFFYGIRPDFWFRIVLTLGLTWASLVSVGAFGVAGELLSCLGRFDAHDGQASMIFFFFLPSQLLLLLTPLVRLLILFSTLGFAEQHACESALRSVQYTLKISLFPLERISQ